MKNFLKKTSLLKCFSKQFSQKPVRIPYDDLIQYKNKKEILFKNLEEAYGQDGLGLMVIEKVPQFVEARTKLLTLMHKVVNLPPQSLKKLERPELSYSLGWSHGKEYFNDQPDFLKGFYHAKLLQYSAKNPSEINVWPEEIPELQQAFHDVGNKIRSIGFVIMDLLNSYIKSVYPKYNLNYRKIIEDSMENTGRILYYFPKNKLKGMENIDQDNWCEWHNDHGSLTGLCSAMYVKEDGKETSISLTKTGLYVQNRKGEVVKVTYGKDDIAFQLGETLQVHSGGILHATPHAVKVMDDIPDNIARITFALFMEPNKDVQMNIPEGSKLENIVTSSIYKVPKIQDRYKEGMTFGNFNDATYSKFYK